MEKNRVLIFLVLISLVSFLINLSNAKLCAEESCKSVIATGVTTVRSSPKAKGYLGFRPNVPVKILSRKDGPKSDLCLVEIQGQVGLVSHKHILEKKIIIRMEDLIEIAEVPKEEEEQIQIKPSIKDIEPTHTESLPQVNPTQNIVTQGDSSNVSEEVSSEATPVVEESEIVDGTQLPVELDDKVTLTTEPTREEELEFDESMVSLNETSDEEMSASTEVPNLTVTDSILEDMKSTSRHLLFNEEDLFEVNSEKKDNIDESKEDIREQSIEGNLKSVQENNVTEEPKEIDPPKIIEGLVTPPETESKIEESVIEPEVPTELNKSQNQEEVKSSEKEETASDIIQSLPNLEGREKPTLNEIPEPHQDPISSTLSTPLSDDYHESFAHLPSSEDVTSSTTKDTIVGKVESENTNIAPEVSIQDVLPENGSTTTDSFEGVESEDEITPVLFEDVTSEEIISSGNVDSNLTDSENVPDKVILKDDDEDEKKTSYDPYSQIQHHHHDPYAQLHSHKHQLGHESHNQLSQESISEENHLNESNVEEMNHQKDLTKEREMISEEIIDIPSHKEVEADTQIHNEIQSKDHSHEHNYGNLEQEQESKIIPDYPTDSLHMLPPLMRRHGNQKQEISKIEVESKPALEEKVLVTESEEVKIAEPGFYDSLLLSITSLWSSNPGKKEDIVDIFSAPPISEHEGFCEKVGPNECPNSKIIHSSSVEYETCNFPKNVLSSATQTILDNINILAVTAIAGIIVFVLILSYNCMNNCKRESELISRLNKTERDLLASMKELDIARFDLSGTQSKLSSIEDNSFGSNDMVIALRKDLEVSHSENEQLLEQIENLEKELDTATEAGLELNKIIAELLSAQNGDENIVSSVEELQKQLNEQQSTILDINTILAQKSRENSELQILLAESNAKYVSEIESLKTDNEELENERNLIQSKLEEIKQGFEHDISAALESKNGEIRLLQTEIMQWKPRYDEVYKNWQTCEAKIEALQESLKQVKIEGAGGKPSEVLNIANIKADMSALKKENDILKERLESQMDSKSSMTEQLKTVTEEIEKIKQDFHQAEKDKLEAQTRLEVLSNYFKDKETQLQKELSVKEAMWLKQQGETTTTVERVKNMQEEIQSLKSQNDSLRAEIEAQTAAHKAQIGTLENRAHETWLAARQSERKYEEARLEGANLRRKLTQLSQNGVSQNTTDGIQSNTSINSAPSPVHMEAPGSPILQLPPPPPFLPPSFMGLPPPPMMGPGGAPPPFPPMFLPPGEIRPPPLGRLMSPPPHHHSRYIDDGNSILDDDYDDEYDDYNEDRRPRVYSRNGRFTPDSRYDYNSRYDTETDFSPPPSPTSITRSEDGQIRRNGFKDRDHRDRRGASQRNGNNGLNESSGRSKKGLISSGSEKSYNSRRSKGNNV